MTKKEKQIEINKNAMVGMELWDQATAVISRERLYHCKAEVLELDNDCLALVSYGTLVAVFDRLSGFFYDVLRYTYGYTATSAQHITKFRSMLRNSILMEYRYYPI